MPDNINWTKQYTQKVCQQVRWARAHPGLAEELSTHLLDQRDAYLAQGMEEGKAQAESLRQMGDPVDVGTRLDQIHRPRPQWDLLVLVGILVAAGMALQSALQKNVPWTVMIPGVAVGIVLMLGLYFLDYTALGLGVRPFILWGLGVGCVSLSFLVSPVVNDRYYYPVFPLLASPVCMALLLYGLRGKGWKGLLLGMGGVGIFAGQALMVPQVSLAALILASGMALVLSSVWKGWLGVPKGAGTAAVLFGAAVPGTLFLIRHAQGLTRRMALLLYPEQDPLGAGYTAAATRALMKGAKWVGQGTFKGDVERILPGLESDYLLIWVVHRLGWWAGAVLAALLALLLIVAIRRCMGQRGMLGRLLSTAVVFILSTEFILYVLSNLGLNLFSPIALPFLSWGRCYMVVNLALTGLLLSTFREESLPHRARRYEYTRRWSLRRMEGGVVITIPVK